MDEEHREVVIETDKARAGSTNHVVRFVLGISLTLAIVALGLVWWAARG